MSNLISELDSDPDMQKRFEQMMQELMSGGVPGMSEGMEPTPALSASAAKDVKATESTSKKAAPASGPAGFEDTIKRTMDRINATDASATAAATSAEPSEEDLLAQMMKELGAGGGMDGEGEQDFNKMLMTMMTQLTNKEILYEPMKELHDKFPGWMETNKGKTEKSEMQRYKEQQRLVGEIVGRFERKGYSDENEDDREFIVERMQKVRSDLRCRVSVPVVLTCVVDASSGLAAPRSSRRHELSARSCRWDGRAMSDAVMSALLGSANCTC